MVHYKSIMDAINTVTDSKYPTHEPMLRVNIFPIFR